MKLDELLWLCVCFPDNTGEALKEKSPITSHLMGCVHFPYTTGSYIIEQDLCESAGCLYDN